MCHYIVFFSSDTCDLHAWSDPFVYYKQKNGLFIMKCSLGAESVSSRLDVPSGLLDSIELPPSHRVAALAIT